MQWTLSNLPVCDAWQAQQEAGRLGIELPAVFAQANRLLIPSGFAPARGWVLMVRGDVLKLQRESYLTMNVTDDAGRPLTVNHLVFIHSRRLFPGIVADPNALCLVELADRRYLCRNELYAVGVNKHYNVWSRDYHDFTTVEKSYLVGSLNGANRWTWSELVQDLWLRLPALGPWLGLPISPDDYPSNWRFPGTAAYDALEQVLSRLACTLSVDLTHATTPYRIVQIGNGDSTWMQTQTLAQGQLLTDRDILESDMWRAAGNVRVLFHQENEYYGNEPTTDSHSLGEIRLTGDGVWRIPDELAVQSFINIDLVGAGAGGRLDGGGGGGADSRATIDVLPGDTFNYHAGRGGALNQDGEDTTFGGKKAAGGKANGKGGTIADSIGDLGFITAGFDGTSGPTGRGGASGRATGDVAARDFGGVGGGPGADGRAPGGGGGCAFAGNPGRGGDGFIRITPPTDGVGGQWAVTPTHAEPDVAGTGDPKATALLWDDMPVWWEGRFNYIELTDSLPKVQARAAARAADYYRTRTKQAIGRLHQTYSGIVVQPPGKLLHGICWRQEGVGGLITEVVRQPPPLLAVSRDGRWLEDAWFRASTWMQAPALRPIRPLYHPLFQAGDVGGVNAFAIGGSSVDSLYQFQLWQFAEKHDTNDISSLLFDWYNPCELVWGFQINPVVNPVIPNQGQGVYFNLMRLLGHKSYKNFTATTFSTPGASGNYTVPAGITRLLVEAEGGGAGGGFGGANYGGGGGEYARSILSVTPGDVIAYAVANTAASGVNGNVTTFGGIQANGGVGTVGGTGGFAQILRHGGDGHATLGGGGSGGGKLTPGSDGTATGGAATYPGGKGGDSGGPGTSPGGGGGYGASGAGGWIKISAPPSLPVYGFLFYRLFLPL